MNNQTDYRQSHTAKGYGESYDVTFKQKNYRGYIWTKEKAIIDEILVNYFPNGVDSYLDFACGTGRVISHVESQVKNSFGVDISEAMLKVAKENTTKSTLIQADLTKENILGERKFKLISSFRFFLNAQKELRKEVMAVLADRLADDGYLFFNVHNNTSSIANRLSKLYALFKHGKITPRNEMSISDVKSLLRDNNMEIIKIYNYATYPVFKEEGGFPKGITGSIDKLFSQYIKVPSLSRYLIFVCKKK